MNTKTKAAAELELRKRQKQRWKNNPAQFAKERLGLNLTPDQTQVLDTLANPNAPTRVAVKAANAVGKTFLASVAVTWWMETKESPICYTTAPTFRQVKNNLWKEIRVRHREANPPLRGALLPKDTRWDISEEIFAEGVAASDEESLKGQHSPDMLLVVDEAQGVEASIYSGIKTMLKGRRARLLLIGNTSTVGGEFYSAFHESTAIYTPLSISASTHPNIIEGLKTLDVTWAEWKQIPHGQNLLPADWTDPFPGAVSLTDLDTAKLDYGIDTPSWQVVVEGIFPKTGDRTLIELLWLEQARTGQLKPQTLPNYLNRPVGKTAGLDVARFGPDRSVMVYQDNGTVQKIEEWQGYELSHTAGKAAEAVRQGYKVYFDEGGLGAAITSHLKEAGINTETQAVPVNAGSAPTPKAANYYRNRRGELWGGLADLLRAQHVDLTELPPETYRKLVGELSALHYELDAKGRKIPEAKDAMKKRIGRSPDLADALCLAMHKPPQQLTTRITNFWQ